MPDGKPPTPGAPPPIQLSRRGLDLVRYNRELMMRAGFTAPATALRGEDWVTIRQFALDTFQQMKMLYPDAFQGKSVPDWEKALRLYISTRRPDFRDMLIGQLRDRYSKGAAIQPDLLLREATEAVKKEGELTVLDFLKTSGEDEYDAVMSRLEAESVKNYKPGKPYSAPPHQQAELHRLMAKMGPKEFMRRNAERLQMHLGRGAEMSKKGEAEEKPKMRPPGVRFSFNPAVRWGLMSPDEPLLPHSVKKEGNSMSDETFLSGFFDEIDKIAKKERKMPHFTEQDRPEGVKKVYRALEHDTKKQSEMRRRYGAEHKAVAARIAARQGKKGKQHQGPPYAAPLSGQ